MKRSHGEIPRPCTIFPISSPVRNERVKTYSKTIMKVMQHAQNTVWKTHGRDRTGLHIRRPAVMMVSRIFENGPAKAIAAAVVPLPESKRTW